MPQYRVYELDEKGQSSSRAPSIGNWKDATEAQINARVLLNGRVFEIWCGERKVATIKPGV